MAGKVFLKGYIDVPPERLEEVSEALPLHIELTRKEPGCLTFNVDPCPHTPGRFLVFECFVNQQAFDTHQIRTRTSHWAEITEGLSRNYSTEIED